VILHSWKWILKFQRNMLPPSSWLTCDKVHKCCQKGPHERMHMYHTTYSPCAVPNSSLDQVQSPLTSNGPSFQTAHITYHVHTLVPSTLKMDKACFSNMLVYHSLNSNRLKNQNTHILLHICSTKKNVHTKYIREFNEILLFKKGWPLGLFS